MRRRRGGSPEGGGWCGDSLGGGDGGAGTSHMLCLGEMITVSSVTNAVGT